MTAPLCEWCQQVQVRRAYGAPVRLVDGTNWRRFCSRECGLKSHHFASGARGWREERFQKHVARVIAMCRDVVTPEGLVPLKDMVRTIVKLERKAYASGRWSIARKPHKPRAKVVAA